MPHPNINLPVAERFEMKVDRSGECHRWTGAHLPDGYATFAYMGRNRRAHVVALLLAGIEVPAGMTVDHVWARGCKYRDCVRVEHLEVVTRGENVLRGGNPAAINSRKSTCIRGHELRPHKDSSVDRRRPKCLACQRQRYAETGRR